MMGLLIANTVLLAVAIVLLLFRRASSMDAGQLEPKLREIQEATDRSIPAMRDEMARSREEAASSARALREEVGQAIATMQSTLVGSHAVLTEQHQNRFDELRTAVDRKLGQIQEENGRRLEEMRKTVDEKLQGVLEKRLGESFRQVSERLEQVHKGLGEMQTLASGVGDLKNVLTNVKVRGTWAEFQLGNLLSQVLTPDQYEQNVAVRKGTDERVEFAIKLPGKDGREGAAVWLPIDSKFPKEDFERLIAASERADVAGVEEAGRALEARVKQEARDIRDKYIHPPETTNFAVLFLPSEGLYAEVLRRPGLVEYLQSQCRVNITGPTTLAALLNSLQMGFRTLAIEKRSSEVWNVLAKVKTEFGVFGDLLEKVRKKIDEAGSAIDQSIHRTGLMEKKLRKVEELPATDAPPGMGDVPARARLSLDDEEAESAS